MPVHPRSYCCPSVIRVDTLCQRIQHLLNALLAAEHCSVPTNLSFVSQASDERPRVSKSSMALRPVFGRRVRTPRFASFTRPPRLGSGHGLALDARRRLQRFRGLLRLRGRESSEDKSGANEISAGYGRPYHGSQVVGVVLVGAYSKGTDSDCLRDSEDAIGVFEN